MKNITEHLLRVWAI